MFSEGKSYRRWKQLGINIANEIYKSDDLACSIFKNDIRDARVVNERLNLFEDDVVATVSLLGLITVAKMSIISENFHFSFFF